MARVVMAMSGGVDSSVAAALLCRAGHEVIGVFMRHGEAPVESETTACASNSATQGGQLPIVSGRLDHKQGCCSVSDAEDARRVAEQLGIPFYALNLSDDFARIIDYFVDEYTAARTPNPCVMCNHWLKFGKLYDYADRVGAEFVATGHYARVESSESCSQIDEPWDIGAASSPLLLRGLDPAKDQSYVLFGVDRGYLSRMMLPIGNYRKNEIRQLAREFGLRVADKRDSQEICFVSSGDHAEFVRRRRFNRCGSRISSSTTRVANEMDETESAGPLDSSGQIVLADGSVVGQHDGIEAFTIGQRKGLGVAMGEPYYVTRIEAASRRVFIGRREELARSELTANRANWLVDAPTAPFRASVQIRYNSAAAPAVVEPLENGQFRVRFEEPRYGVAPGQAAVCYDGNYVLGGGWIE
ncbi:MAG TPA: tRNA 2-thiouridine(34) synthase MnmA [Pirellulales bacterium]|nr:tRNA 2-thiouridine(34) synthase MnmA [Pirellulales bacterium]